jgi:hypothetical protein
LGNIRSLLPTSSTEAGDGGGAISESKPPESKVPKLDPPPEDSVQDNGDDKQSSPPETKATDPPVKSPIAEENVDTTPIRLSPPEDLPDFDSGSEF